MHRFLSLLIIFLICISGTQISAQQSPSSSKGKTEKTFAQASDSQIEEAQRYYRACIGNETLSERKNCKCAATEYLETRIKLGKTASIDDILGEISGSCMKDGTEAQTENQNKEMSGVTDKQKAEAIDVYRECKYNDQLNHHFKCDCLASRFLDKRIEHGPFVDRKQIVSELNNECRNVVQKTGFVYTRCIDKPIFFDLKNVEKSVYCECTAREFGKLYKNYKQRIDSRSQSKMESQASMTCRKALIP